MSEKEFNWTSDQFERYVVVALCAAYFFKDKEASVLDVGGVSPNHTGERLWLPAQEILNNPPVVSPQEDFTPAKFSVFVVDLTYCREPGAIQGNGCFLPFKNNSFDLVASLDTLEHIPPESRKQFLSELCRVSRDLVFLSAPSKNKDIELVEEALFTQIKQLYGLEHQQLRQHRQYGLPSSEEITRLLAEEAGSVENFSCGSVESFFFFQSIKNLYLFHPHARQLLSLLDEFIINRLRVLESQPPYSRYFWLAAKRRDKGELKKGIDHILNIFSQHQVHLGKNKDPERNFLSELVQINKEITWVSHPETVSAIIVAKKGGEVLERCLKFLLSQDVYFPLEIAVWDLSENSDIRYQLKSFFPPVTDLCLKKKKERAIREAFLEVACQVRGTYLLFLDEKIALPPDGVATLFEAARQEGGEKLVCPRVVDERERPRVGFFPEGRPSLPWKNLVKLLEKAASEPGEGRTWTWSECVLLKRSLLALLGEAGEKKKVKKRPLNQRNNWLFFWGPSRVTYLNEYSVSWREW